MSMLAVSLCATSITILLSSLFTSLSTLLPYSSSLSPLCFLICWLYLYIIVIYCYSLLNNQCINKSMDQVSSYWIFFYLMYVYSIASLQAVSLSPFLPSLHFPLLSYNRYLYIHKESKKMFQHTITIYIPTHIQSATIITTLTLNPYINVSYLHLFASPLYI
jgi:hypothetical protein